MAPIRRVNAGQALLTAGNTNPGRVITDGDMVGRSRGVSVKPTSAAGAGLIPSESGDDRNCSSFYDVGMTACPWSAISARANRLIMPMRLPEGTLTLFPAIY